MSMTFICPNCGFDVPVGAAACPECGSDEETGWSTAAAYDGLWLDDAPPRPRARSPWRERLTRPRAGGLTARDLLVIITVVALLATIAYGNVYLLAAAIVAMGALYVWLFRPFHGRSTVEDERYRALLLRARGDRDLVERWVAYERRRNPGAPRAELLADALNRWARDNR